MKLLTREMQVANAEFSAMHMNGEIHSTATAQVLDIAVASVFRPARDYKK